MIGIIGWKIDVEDNGITIKSVEVVLTVDTSTEFQFYLVGDNGLSHDLPVGPTWKSEAFSGSKRLKLLAQSFSNKMEVLMPVKMGNLVNEPQFTIKVKLKDKLYSKNHKCLSYL